MANTNGKGIKLNGSVTILAQALHGVFAEALESVTLHVDKVEQRLDKKIEAATKTTNKNMQYQVSQLRKDFAHNKK